MYFDVFGKFMGKKERDPPPMKNILIIVTVINNQNFICVTGLNCGNCTLYKSLHDNNNNNINISIPTLTTNSRNPSCDLGISILSLSINGLIGIPFVASRSPWWKNSELIR